MGKPYDERRKRLNLAAYRLRLEGLSNRAIAERIGVDVEQVPGMVLAGSRIVQTLPNAEGTGTSELARASDTGSAQIEKGSPREGPPARGAET